MTTVSVLALASQQQMIKTQTIKRLIQSTFVILFLSRIQHSNEYCNQTALQLGIELLYVPPYSPWFNPIEGVFSIVKRAFYIGLSIDESSQKKAEESQKQ